VKTIIRSTILSISALVCIQQAMGKDVSMAKVVLKSPYISKYNFIEQKDLREIQKNLRDENFTELKRRLVRDLEQIKIDHALRSGGNDAGNGGFVVEKWEKFFLLDLLEREENELQLLPHINHIPIDYSVLLTSLELSKTLLNTDIFNFDSVEEIIESLRLITYLSSSKVEKVEIVGVENDILFERMFKYHTDLDEKIIPAARVLDNRIYINLKVWNKLERKQRIVLMVHELLQFITTKNTNLTENQRYIVREIVRELFINYDAFKAKKALEEVLNEYSK
jgi:hypothetical protein